MKTTVILLIAASSVLGDVFKQRIKVGRLTCTCSFSLIAAGTKLSPESKAKCDKKCSGVAKRVSLEGDSGVFTFDMKVAKGKVSLSKGSVKVATTTEMTTQTTEATGTTEDGITPVGTENNTGGSEPGPTGTGPGSEPEPEPTGTGSGSGPEPEPTGSGSEPGPEPTGTGSGEEPVPIGTGSGTGEEPVPIGTGSGSGPGTGSGSGPGPKDGMQCSCKCDCPDGNGQCDCDCNCPMQSMAMVCAPGFTRVCPMMEEGCPPETEKVCPKGMEEEPFKVQSRMSGGPSGCQCVPDFLMSLMKEVKVAVEPADRAVAPDVFKNLKLRMGKAKCTCTLSLLAAGPKLSPKSKATCDKKCTGSAKKVVLTGKSGNVYTLDIVAKKGKAKLKGTVKLGAVVTTPKPTPPPGTPKPPGSGSGNPPGPGGVGGQAMGPSCSCVATKMGGGGTPTGPGPEPGSETGSGSGSETGSGTGSGSEATPMPGNETTGSGSTPPSQMVTIPQRSWEYITTEMDPTPGPLGETPYIPGTPGGQWSDDEVIATRLRILQMIHPHWDVKKAQGTWNGVGVKTTKGQVTENTILRLVFHDCGMYTDGTGGCDGCINWKGMHQSGPSPHDKDDYYGTEPIKKTDNNGMDQITEKLELIYSTIDWPFQNTSLETSLQQSGKSRADLWELAGLVALERTIERANRACDLDFHARQQVTLLESRDKCEIKLKKPLKFLTGRSDCVSEDPEGRGYVAGKTEEHPNMFGDAKEIIDFGKTMFGIDAQHWTALQAIHGVVHAPANLGIKYTWFGSGYLTNMYFKMIANKKRYRFEEGGDLSFGDAVAAANIFKTAVGDQDGNPVAQNGWRASCMMAWNTTEGGPCLLRPTPATAFDSPNPDKMAHPCVKEVASNGTCVIDTKWGKRCENTWCDDKYVEHGSKAAGVDPVIEGEWYPNATDQRWRHSEGWSNQFAFPWEIGLYWNFTVGGVAQRAVGCPGLDTPFGTVDEPNWPFRTSNSPIFASPAMQCEVNTYAPEGKPMHQIVDDLANDNEHFAEMFLEGWEQMTSNGYSPEQLVDGPQSGWLGYNSLTNQGVEIPDFETYIQENAPLTFTDPKADPYICGHRGHAMVSCGIKFSTGYAAKQFEGPGDDGPGF